MVEMEEMASRPFASVTVEVDRKPDQAEKKETNSTDLRKRKKVKDYLKKLIPLVKYKDR